MACRSRTRSAATAYPLRATPLSVGLFGRYSRIANELIEASDCLLVVGCKLGEIATKRYALPPDGAPLDPPRRPRRGDRPHWARTAVGLWGDAREGLLALACGAARTRAA